MCGCMSSKIDSKIDMNQNKFKFPFKSKCCNKSVKIVTCHHCKSVIDLRAKPAKHKIFDLQGRYENLTKDN